MLNQTILSAALLLCGLGAQAQTAGDTLVIEKPNQVKIETRDTVQRIVVRGMKDNEDFYYTQRISINSPADVRRSFSNMRDFNKVKLSKNKCKQDKKGTVEAALHVNVGATALTGMPEGYTGKVGFGETAFAVTADWYPYGARNSWSIGLGVDWRRYCMGTEKFLMKDAADYLVPVSFGSTMSDCSTHLYTFSVQVPVIYTHTFDPRGKWAVSLGAIVSFNTGAHATRCFSMDGEDYDIKTYKIGQRPVTVDFMLGLKTSFLPAFYVKYSPMNYFKDSRGPKGHQLSFGIGI